METVANKLNIFGRLNSNGDINILHVEDGAAVTRITEITVWPVGSDFGSGYEHPEGITVTIADAVRLGLAEYKILTD